MADVRRLVHEAEYQSTRRQRRTRLTGAVGLILVGSVFVVTGVRQPGALVFGGFLAALGLASVAAVVARSRRRGPVVREVVVVGLPATVVRRPRGEFAAGIAMLAVIAASPITIAIVGAVRGRGGSAVPLGVIGAVVWTPVLMAAIGRSAAGELLLNPHLLRYRRGGLESVVAWDDVSVVDASELTQEVRLHLVSGCAAPHRRRGWRGRGPKDEVETSVVLGVRGWGLLATDLARLLLRYADDPAARSELGTPAARARLTELRERPVRTPFDRWVVGSDTGAGEDADTCGDGWTLARLTAAIPVWSEPSEVVAARVMTGFYRGRVIGGFAVLAAALAVTAVAAAPGLVGVVMALGLAVAAGAGLAAALVNPRPPELAPSAPPGRKRLGGADGLVLRRSRVRLRLGVAACTGVAVAVAALTVHGAGGSLLSLTIGAGVGVCGLLLLPVLVVARVVTTGELTIGEERVSYRSGLRSWSVPWGEVATVDLLVDDVVRLGLHDGRVLRLDAREMAARGPHVTAALSYYVGRGGPFGETRDVTTVQLRLRDRW